MHARKTRERKKHQSSALQIRLKELKEEVSFTFVIQIIDLCYQIISFFLPFFLSMFSYTMFSFYEIQLFDHQVMSCIKSTSFHYAYLNIDIPSS